MGTGGNGVSYEKGASVTGDDTSAGPVKSLSELEETDPRLFPSAEMKFTSPLSFSKSFCWIRSKKMRENMKKED